MKIRPTRTAHSGIEAAQTARSAQFTCRFLTTHVSQDRRSQITSIPGVGAPAHQVSATNGAISSTCSRPTGMAHRWLCRQGAG